MADGKMPQILDIEPSRELMFAGPFTDVVNATLTLRNPSEKTVCFKVKTTAPRQYCVRPNSGVICSGQSMTVYVMLQPLDGAPPIDVSKHKFMVQASFTPDVDMDLESFWKTADPAQIMYSKLTVAFEQPRVITQHFVGGEETSIAPQYVSPLASIALNDPVTKSSKSSVVEDAVQMREEVEARKKVESEKASLQREVNELFKKNAKLQQDAQTASVQTGLPTVQVIILAIAALIIGLIVGKLF